MAIFADAPRSRGILARPTASTSFFADLADRFTRWRDYRRTLAELQLLSDRELADIGVYRCDVPRVARSAAGF